MSLVRSAPMQTTDIRAHNLGVVLSYLDEAGEAARAEIAAGTGLVRGSITLLIAELLEAGLVRPVGAVSSGRGRPLERLEVDGSRRALVAVRIAVDEVAALAVDLAGRDLVREATVVRLPHGRPDAVADRVATVFAEVAERLAEEGVAVQETLVVVPAPVLLPAGSVPAAIDLGWWDVDLIGLLRDRLPAGLPVPVVVNDADAATVAEFSALRAEDAPSGSVAYLKSDTGVGGGLMVDGRLVTGRDGMAFEPGHLVVQPEGILCACGRRGCLATVADPERVVAAAGLAGMRERDGMPAAEAELVRRWERGDPAAVAVVEELTGWLARAVDAIEILLRPDAVVLGGYIAAFAGLVRERLATDAGLGPAPVLAGRHGPFASLDGAVELARRAILADPSRLLH